MGTLDHIVDDVKCRVCGGKLMLHVFTGEYECVSCHSVFGFQEIDGTPNTAATSQAARQPANSKRSNGIPPDVIKCPECGGSFKFAEFTGTYECEKCRLSMDYPDVEKMWRDGKISEIRQAAHDAVRPQQPAPPEKQTDGYPPNSIKCPKCGGNFELQIFLGMYECDRCRMTMKYADVERMWRDAKNRRQTPVRSQQTVTPPQTIAPQQTAQKKYPDKLIYKPKVWGVSQSGSSVQSKPEKSASSDFEIVNGTLVKYKGRGGTVVIPSGITYISDKAFYNCDSVTDLRLSDALTGIGSYAFYNCDGLNQIVFPSSLKSIGDYAFYNCDGLERVIFPSSLTKIGAYAFYNCDGLRSVDIASANIGCYAFYNCDGLVDVKLGRAARADDHAFYNCNSKLVITCGPSCAFWGTNWNPQKYKVVIR